MNEKQRLATDLLTLVSCGMTDELNAQGKNRLLLQAAALVDIMCEPNGELNLSTGEAEAVTTHCDHIVTQCVTLLVDGSVQSPWDQIQPPYRHTVLKIAAVLPGIGEAALQAVQDHLAQQPAVSMALLTDALKLVWIFSSLPAWATVASQIGAQLTITYLSTDDARSFEECVQNALRMEVIALKPELGQQLYRTIYDGAKAIFDRIQAQENAEGSSHYLSQSFAGTIGKYLKTISQFAPPDTATA